MSGTVTDGHSEVVVIGGGQAGLATARELIRHGIAPVVLDASEEVGQSWRKRYDSLRLFTPSQYSSLPGLPFPRRNDHYASKDEVAEYLVAYARHFGIDVRLRCRATRVVREGGHFVVEVNGTQRITTDVVVIATGTLQTPFVPPFARLLGESVQQLHSSEYRNNSQLPPGDVCVVGAGNSGVQIAEELARERSVDLSLGEMPKRLPQRFLGRDIFWWMDILGMMDARAEEKATSAAGSIPIIGTDLKRLVRSRAVRTVPRVANATTGALLLEGGRRLQVDNVIWATGFVHDFGWIDVPGALEDGKPLHTDGVSIVPGLYFVGLPWLATKGSGFLGWVGRDAGRLAEVIAAQK